jgi:hypothetical protein
MMFQLTFYNHHQFVVATWYDMIINAVYGVKQSVAAVVALIEPTIVSFVVPIYCC